MLLFINPMWTNESKRIGKQKCTPTGYALHVISDYLGLIGLLLLVGVGAVVTYRGVAGTLHAGWLWLFAFPFGLAIVGTILYRYSWLLAHKKGFS